MCFDGTETASVKAVYGDSTDHGECPILRTSLRFRTSPRAVSYPRSPSLSLSFSLSFSFFFSSVVGSIFLSSIPIIIITSFIRKLKMHPYRKEILSNILWNDLQERRKNAKPNLTLIYSLTSIDALITKTIPTDRWAHQKQQWCIVLWIKDCLLSKPVTITRWIDIDRINFEYFPCWTRWIITWQKQMT